MTIRLLLFWLKISIVIFYSDSALSNEITENQFSVHGLSAFDEQQAKKLEDWLTQGVNATRATLGVYPTPLALYLYPKQSNQPVPWAHTRRDAKGSVHFYVDARFPLQKFVNDWTIYHELAHMALPYLGAKYRWLSEGFASYMQYQIMHHKGVLDGTLQNNYQRKISPHLRWFNSDLTAASIAERLMDNKQYPAAYWGGAYFFVLANKQLKQRHNINLNQLVSHYQDCCRKGDHNLEEVLSSFDQMLQDPLFSQLIQQFQHAPARQLYPETFSQE